MRIRAVVTDIEGTTSSIAFVKEVLFPYAARELPGFLAAKVAEPAVASELDAVRALAGEPAAGLARLTALLLEWIAADRKATPLKSLQGMLWRAGYERGELRAHLYPDVPERLRAWKNRGLLLAVYSSGSVAAQRLFFRHSEAGDLEGLFSHFFDTTTGAKQDPASYRRIADALELEPAAILFLSDSAAELDAAAAAGFATCGLERDAPLAAVHPCASDFQRVEPHLSE